MVALKNTKNMDGTQTEALVTLGTATAKKPVNATLVNSNGAGFGSSGFFSSEDVLPSCPADELDDVLPVSDPCPADELDDVLLPVAAPGSCCFIASLW